MPNVIVNLISHEDAQGACQEQLNAPFKLDFLKPAVYAGEDFQYAIAAGNVPDGRWSKRVKFVLTADLAGKVTSVARCLDAVLLKVVKRR
jgi:hypothetical protein